MFESRFAGDHSRLHRRAPGPRPAATSEGSRRDRQVGRTSAAHGHAAAPPARARNRVERAAERRRPAADPAPANAGDVQRRRRRAKYRRARARTPTNPPPPTDSTVDLGSRRRARMRRSSLAPRRSAAAGRTAARASRSERRTAELMSAKPDEPEEQLAEGTLMSHLLELRSRLMKAVLAVDRRVLAPHAVHELACSSTSRSRCARRCPKARR